MRGFRSRGARSRSTAISWAYFRLACASACERSGGQLPAPEPRTMTRSAPRLEVERAQPRLSREARRNFAVIIPAYDEVANVPDLVRELRATWQRYELEGEVLLIDDGSTDGTAKHAAQVAADWDCFRVIRHRRNFGKTEALVTGAEHTAARWRSE